MLNKLKICIIAVFLAASVSILTLHTHGGCEESEQCFVCIVIQNFCVCCAQVSVSAVFFAIFVLISLKLQYKSYSVRINFSRAPPLFL
ncbi:MAG: hypothetical protein LBR69_03560 [Endomicrobium sp.]|nr:hypothetical protein [Endomicrobium sp.]